MNIVYDIRKFDDMNNVRELIWKSIRIRIN
jgi:hypothetical protein